MGGRNREITVEILRSGTILIGGTIILDISAGETNRVSIALDSVIQREIINGDWILLNDSRLVAFYDDGSVSETDGVNVALGAYRIWGN